MRFIRFILGLFGIAALLVAIAALAAEAAALVSGGTLFATPLGKIWRELDYPSLQAVEVGISRHLGLNWLWLHAVIPLLALPPATVAGLFAAAGFVLLGLRRLLRRRA